MEEIEVKILEVDREAIEKRLQKMGAQFQFEHEFDAILYDDAQATIQHAKDLLRLRKEGPESVLTYKKFISDDGVKIRKEYETAVADFAQMRQILGQLGYRETLRLRKIRRQYKLPAAKILFDDYLNEHDWIPEFMEIETESREALEDLVTQLGLAPDQCLNWTTHDLIAHYGKSD